ncbi:MAG: anaerobic ribonucleoside-triphosphate reductase activating protein [Thermoguttaceae bacterium]|nr:anaerobic ribonucleoside-triphosphate reductase activating protein [Thermoguttaceae bacterium]
MDLRGLYKFSLVDYPGKIACIVFTGGCNLRCAFCHNPVLVFDPTSQPRVTQQEFFHYLERRKGLLEGVVVTGGEPMLHPDLGEFIEKIHQAGYLVKLDTNGSFPDRLAAILESPGVDALGMDYKTSAENYCSVVGIPDSELADRVRQSITLAMKYRQEKGTEVDVRTTVHKSLHPMETLVQMKSELMAMNVIQWTLQQFNPVETIDSDLPSQPTYADHELVACAKELTQDGFNVRVRGLAGRIL